MSGCSLQQLSSLIGWITQGSLDDEADDPLEMLGDSVDFLDDPLKYQDDTVDWKDYSWNAKMTVVSADNIEKCWDDLLNSWMNFCDGWIA